MKQTTDLDKVKQYIIKLNERISLEDSWITQSILNYIYEINQNKKNSLLE